MMRLKLSYNNIIGKTREYRANIPKSERISGLSIIFISLWLILLLFMPFIEDNYSEKGFTLGIVIGVILQALAVLSILINAIGIRRTAFIAVGIVFLTWLIEAVGIATGFPFGRYYYTERLQPQLLNVPILIPLAWLMMLPPSWAVAQRITRQKKGIRFAILSGLAFTVWDLFLDPQMVKWFLWVWDKPNGYFGIPFTNFLGWFFSSALITIIIRPASLPERPLLLIYGLTWIMETIGLIVFWDLRVPALSGFVGMGIFILLAYCIKPREKTCT
jgi:lycopene beta-cyclase